MVGELRLSVLANLKVSMIHCQDYDRKLSKAFTVRLLILYRKNQLRNLQSIQECPGVGKMVILMEKHIT